MKAWTSSLGLALNLHWSWNHASDEIWESLDAELWQTTQNPWVILRTVSRAKIQALLANPDFRQRLESCQRHNQKIFTEDAWFQKKHSGSALSLVAYFSMEFMLTEALPIYSGGLGNVAGDQMKAASNLGVPVVGIGLLYGQVSGVRDIFARISIWRATNRRFFRSTTRTSCPFGRCARRTANG